MSWAAKVCPRCQVKGKTFHLMMAECDDCINEICSTAVEPFVLRRGLLVPNPQTGT